LLPHSTQNNKNLKYYIIAGEASGDLHASNLIKQLHLKDNQANIQCWGGNLMQAANATLVKHYKELAFMGFAEVIKNLPTILKNISFCKQDILTYKPDVLILVDYPGFNLRIAKWAKQQGLKVVYYISPQVWAWKANRVKQMKLCIDKMICIIPFEKQYFKTNWQWDVDYVGHPLLEAIENFKLSNINKNIHQPSSIKNNRKIVALLPGSRKQEIAKKLPIMLSVINNFSNVDFYIAKAPSIDDNFYKPFIEPYKNVFTVANNTYSLLQQASAAMVTSGTATLETALFAVPQVVCYKASNISYCIGKLLIKIKYISLVNLIMDKLVVTELIQNKLTTSNLVEELTKLLNDNDTKETLAQQYKILWNKLAIGGNASEKAASIIIDFLQKDKEPFLEM
jgi:lipid-A-disaccharide synthase